MSIDEALAADYQATDADLAHRQAKAARFIELINLDGMLHPVAFKHLDADPILVDLERKSRYAAAVARAAWLQVSKGDTT